MTEVPYPMEGNKQDGQDLGSIESAIERNGKNGRFCSVLRESILPILSILYKYF